MRGFSLSKSRLYYSLKIGKSQGDKWQLLVCPDQICKSFGNKFAKLNLRNSICKIKQTKSSLRKRVYKIKKMQNYICNIKLAELHLQN